jgi:hypothetical protein
MFKPKVSRVAYPWKDITGIGVVLTGATPALP